MPTCPAKPVHWEFVLSQDEPRQWSWRCIAVDGSIDRHSEAYPTYGSAVDNAIKNGFRPAEQHWLVTTDKWTTHFQKGKPPMSIGQDGGVAPVSRRADLARLHAEIRRRRQAAAAPVAEPVAAIMLHVSGSPNSPASRCLLKLATQVMRWSDTLDESEVWSLDEEALGLLDALIERAIS